MKEEITQDSISEIKEIVEAAPNNEEAIPVNTSQVRSLV
jgi:hypothetical protein